jgi:hypothetical protein
MPIYGNIAVKMAVVKNLVSVKDLQVAKNFGEGGSEGLPRPGNPVWRTEERQRLILLYIKVSQRRLKHCFQYQRYF